MKKFDRDKVLRQIKHKRNRKKYMKYVSVIIPCFVVVVSALYFAYSKYFTSKEIEVIRTTVGDFIYGDVIIAAYIDGKYTPNFPAKNTAIFESVECDNGAIGTWDNDAWGLLTTNLTKRTKCNVYFNRTINEKIVASVDTTGKCPAVGDGGYYKITGPETGSGYICTAPDDNGISYYYRGDVNNNYVDFAGQLWRVIRIDSKGDVRIVLDSNVSTRSKYSDNYVTNTVETIDDAISLVDYKNSNVKTAVDNWYNTNIVPHEDSKYIVNSNFCLDLSYEGPIDTQYVHTVYYFAPYVHVGLDFSEFTPDFTCPTEKVFSSPVGLLTAEEVLAAGGFWGTVNENYYLYNKDLSNSQTSWTMSGSYYSASEKQAGVIVYNLNGNGLFDWVQGGNLAQNYGYRPVITLDGDIRAIGEGTIDNPYKLVTQ